VIKGVIGKIYMKTMIKNGHQKPKRVWMNYDIVK